MYMSQSASSSPTPRSTSRVMMTGLIGPDLRREDWSRPSHDDWRKTCLMESCRWKSHGRSSKDGYHIYRVPPTISLGFPLLKICGSPSHSALPRDVDWQVLDTRLLNRLWVELHQRQYFLRHAHFDGEPQLAGFSCSKRVVLRPMSTRELIREGFRSA